MHVKTLGALLLRRQSSDRINAYETKLASPPHHHTELMSYETMIVYIC